MHCAIMNVRPQVPHSIYALANVPVSVNVTVEIFDGPASDGAVEADENATRRNTPMNALRQDRMFRLTPSSERLSTNASEPDDGKSSCRKARRSCKYGDI